MMVAGAAVLGGAYLPGTFDLNWPSKRSWHRNERGQSIDWGVVPYSVLAATRVSAGGWRAWRLHIGLYGGLSARLARRIIAPVSADRQVAPLSFFR